MEDSGFLEGKFILSIEQRNTGILDRRFWISGMKIHSLNRTKKHRDFRRETHSLNRTKKLLKGNFIPSIK